jgi:hypothetical protein
MQPLNIFLPLLLFSTLFCGVALSQRTDDHPCTLTYFDSLGNEVIVDCPIEFPNINCFQPGLYRKVAVKFTNGTAYYLKFNFDSGTIGLRNENSQETEYYQVENGELIVPPIAFGQSYSIVVTNNCEDSYNVALLESIEDINNNRDRNISASSNALFELVAYFKRDVEERSIKQYLNEVRLQYDVHPYEVLSYYQQHMGYGKPYSYANVEMINLSIPEDYHNEATEGLDCNCNALTLANGNNPVNAAHEEQGGDRKNTWVGLYNRIPKDFGDDAEGLLLTVDKGAGLARYVHTTGSKHNPCDLTEHYDSGDHDEENGGNWSQIRLVYTCNNQRGRLDEECSCYKEVNFYYQYDAILDVCTDINKNGGFCWRRKGAYARAANRVVVTEEREQINSYSPTNHINIIDEATWVEELRCDLSPNTDFDDLLDDLLGNLFEDVTLGDIIQVFTGDENVGDIFGGIPIDEIVTGVLDLFREPNVSVENCSDGDGCESSDHVGIDDVYPTWIDDNEIVDFKVLSLPEVSAGGRRSWFSSAKIETNVMMFARIAPGIGQEQAPDASDIGCCSPWAAIFNGSASGARPNNSGQVWARMGGWLAEFPVFEDCLYRWNGPHSKGDFGGCSTMKDVHENCDLPLKFVNGSRGQLNNDLSEMSEVEEIQIYNAMGQLVYERKWTNDRIFKKDLLHIIQNDLRGEITPSAVYFIKLKSEGRFFTEKIISIKP